MSIKKIAIFASGSGTNAENIIKYFNNNKLIRIDSVWSNNSYAYVLTRAALLGIETFVFNREQLYESGEVYSKLKERGIDLIVLAGFLWLVPMSMINDFTIVNIHPALLPKYGGKGMYGMKVHEEVVKNGDTETGISIHYINEKYDEGELIFQAKCPVSPSDTPEKIAQKVHKLEYKYYPEVIEKILMKDR